MTLPVVIIHDCNSGDYSLLWDHTSIVVIKSLAPGRYGCNFELEIFIWRIAVLSISCNISIWLIPQDLTGDQSTLIQIINWASVDPDLCHYMTSLRHNVLTMNINLFFLTWFTEMRVWIISKHIYCFLYDVISHPCPYFNSKVFFLAINDFVFCCWDVLSKWPASSHKISKHLKELHYAGSHNNLLHCSHTLFKTEFPLR